MPDRPDIRCCSCAEPVEVGKCPRGHDDGVFDPGATPHERIVELYEALEGVMPSKCSCSFDQLQDACACGRVLAEVAINNARLYV